MGTFEKRSYRIQTSMGYDEISLQASQYNPGKLTVTINEYRRGWNHPIITHVELNPEIARNVRDLINDFLVESR